MAKLYNTEPFFDRILTTHHHWDHSGGNAKLLKHYPALPCYGGSDQVAGANHKVRHEETFKVGSLDVMPIMTPCHTMDHVCYYVKDGDDHAVFTGLSQMVAFLLT